jgi:hypothetical protein
MSARASLLLIVASSATVVAAIAGGLILVGPPDEVRKKRLDEVRVRDLRALTTAIANFRRTNGRLPEDLSRLQQAVLGPAVRMSDPVSGEAYEYRISAMANNYDLCAVFEAEGRYEIRPPDGVVGIVASPTLISPFWNHGRGRHCFTLGATTGAQF